MNKQENVKRVPPACRQSGFSSQGGGWQYGVTFMVETSPRPTISVCLFQTSFLTEKGLLSGFQTYHEVVSSACSQGEQSCNIKIKSLHADKEPEEALQVLKKKTIRQTTISKAMTFCFVQQSQ